MWLATSYKKSAARRKQPSHPTPQKRKKTKKKKKEKKQTSKQKKQPSLYLQLLHPGNGSLQFVYCLLLQAET
jgi:hypothetical protein